MAQAHFVVISDAGGTPMKFPLKRWLRENPREVPPGLHPDESTSHALRTGLKKVGWRLQFAPAEVLIIKPSADGETAFADELVDAAESDDPQAMIAQLEESTDLTFGLERDLQNALRADLTQLEKGLAIIDGGSEYSTRAGRFDILAKDAQGRAVVIELKAGRADSRAIAQILAYMTSVPPEKGNPVRGILVAGDFDDRVILASRQVPSLELQKYTYQFKFGKV